MSSLLVFDALQTQKLHHLPHQTFLFFIRNK
nr:MAG TPA: hypothetical protein [Caudoviricetes sp.]